MRAVDADNLIFAGYGSQRGLKKNVVYVKMGIQVTARRENLLAQALFTNTEQ
jgi:hypothetical protein